MHNYGIRGVAYSWFESYLKDRKQYVSINGYKSKHLPISLGVPQGSVLGLLLFLICINDLNTAIKHCKVYHFADDTNLLHINDSLKKLVLLLLLLVTSVSGFRLELMYISLIVSIRSSLTHLHGFQLLVLLP